MHRFNTSLVWFRRNLHSFNHATLHHALTASRRVFSIFVFDRTILDSLPRADRRVAFIRDSLIELDAGLRALGGGLLVLHDDTSTAIPALVNALQADADFVNRDYESAAIARDAAVAEALHKNGRILHSFKDPAVFEHDDVLTQFGTPFSLFTPYKNAWMKKLPADGRHTWMPSLAKLNFTGAASEGLPLPPSMRGAQQLFADFAERLPHYDRMRDFPAMKGPSYLSVHRALRHGVDSRPSLSCDRGDAHRSGRQRRGGLAERTGLARLLLHDLGASSARRRSCIQAGIRCHSLGKRRAGGSPVRCGDSVNQPDRLHAQSPAHGDSDLSAQGLRHRLAARRTLFRCKAERLQSVRQQRRLARGCFDRLRRATVFPHFQSSHAIGEVRSRRQVDPPLSAAAGATIRPAHPRVIETSHGWTGSGWHRTRPRLSEASRRP